jgi:hypothetical protein
MTGQESSKAGVREEVPGGANQSAIEEIRSRKNKPHLMSQQRRLGARALAHVRAGER